MVFSFGRLNDPAWAREARFLQQAHQKYHQQGLIIFMIAMGGPKDADLKAFVKRNNLTLPVGDDNDGQGEKLYKITRSPTLIVADAEKRVAYTAVGFDKTVEGQAAAAVRAVVSKATQ